MDLRRGPFSFLWQPTPAAKVEAGSGITCSSCPKSHPCCCRCCQLRRCLSPNPNCWCPNCCQTRPDLSQSWAFGCCYQCCSYWCCCCYRPCCRWCHRRCHWNWANWIENWWSPRCRRCRRDFRARHTRSPRQDQPGLSLRSISSCYVLSWLPLNLPFPDLDSNQAFHPKAAGILPCGRSLACWDKPGTAVVINKRSNCNHRERTIGVVSTYVHSGDYSG